MFSNRSQFTVIGLRLKKEKVEKNYGVLFWRFRSLEKILQVISTSL